MAKKNVEVPKEEVTKPDVIVEQKPLEIGSVEKTELEQSVEESSENVAKGYEEVEVEAKDVNIVEVEAVDPELGGHADADIKQVYTHPNANIEHKIVYETPEQKQADIK